jgi:EmrB/QacA subfamily drug resistance transporter
LKTPTSPEVAPAADDSPAAGGGGLDRALLTVASVVVLGAVMSILDVTVVNVAINHLSEELKSPLSTIQWVATGYTLALATVIPVSGWAADRFGTKRLYMISIALFIIGSAMAGLAWSAPSLIAFRVLQGLGGGMIMPCAMTILTQAAGPQSVGQVMSVVGIPMLLGPICGPILGGYLVDQVSWRWIFYINIPIGILTLLLSWKILAKDKPEPTQRLDVLGLLLLSPGLASLIYGLATGAEKGAFDSAKVLVPAIAGAALVIAFVARSLTAESPLIQLRLLKRRSVASAAGTMMLFGVAFFGAMLLLPLYYQVVRHQSALHAGLLLAPQGFGAMITMPIGGKLTDRVGPGRVVIAGLIIIIAATSVFTQIAADTSFVFLGFTLFLMGLGMGMTMMPTMSAAFQSLTHAEVPRASTMMNIIQQVAGSIGVATMSVVLGNALADRLPGGGSAGGLGAAQHVPPALMAKLAPKIADSFAHTYVVALGLLVVAIVPALLLPRRKPETDPAKAAAEPMPMH